MEDSMTERNKPAANDSTAAKGRKTDPAAEVQGEGDYAADRHYRERTDQFLKDADVEQLARAAAPRSKAEAQEMADAEQAGRSHAHLPRKAERKPNAKPPDERDGR